MAFWGVEVKSGQPFEVNLGKGRLHLDQASLGEYYQKEQQSVIAHLIVNGKKLVLATLDTELLPTEFFNLMLYKNFQISHNMKNTSVYFFGSTYEKREENRTAKKEEGSKARSAFPGIHFTFVYFTLEVKNGQTEDVKVAEGDIVCLDKAHFGEGTEEVDETVFLHITVDGKRLVTGSLHPRTRPEHKFRLLTDRDFQVSHSLSSGNVVFSALRDKRYFDPFFSDEDDEVEETEKKEEGSKGTPATEIETEWCIV